MNREEFIAKAAQRYKVAVYNEGKAGCDRIAGYAQKDAVVNDIGRVKKIVDLSAHTRIYY